MPGLPPDRRPRIWQCLPRADWCADYAAVSGAGKVQGFAQRVEFVWRLLRSLPGQDQHPQAPDQHAAGYRPATSERTIRANDLPAVGVDDEIAAALRLAGLGAESGFARTG